jgi:hypothetical protein
LPDGLTHATVPSGSTDPNTQAQFPPIPDRWLVIRMFPSPRVAPRRAIRGWVLRTGEAQPVVVDLDSWIEPGTKQDTKAPLTAAGHGDPGWAAYYDNVVNRLGFYDDLSDVAADLLVVRLRPHEGRDRDRQRLDVRLVKLEMDGGPSCDRGPDQHRHAHEQGAARNG